MLPWKSEIQEPKLSAFDCSRLYLEHLKDGFLYAEHLQGRNWDLSEGQIVLTVPASFDEVARTLTAEAAEAAGLGKVTLLGRAAGSLLRLDRTGRRNLAQTK